MDREKLENLQEMTGDLIKEGLIEMQDLEEDEERIIPLNVFDSITKGLNETRKQDNELARIEAEKQKAFWEAEARRVQNELEARRLDLEKLKIEADERIANARTKAETEQARIEAVSAEHTSKRSLIERIIDTGGRLLVAGITTGCIIFQIKSIKHEEEEDHMVNSQSMKTWHKPSIRY